MNILKTHFDPEVERKHEYAFFVNLQRIAMINTKVLTSFLGKVCQDGVEQALLVDEGGSVLGVGKADGFDSSVSKSISSRAC